MFVVMRMPVLMHGFQVTAVIMTVTVIMTMVVVVTIIGVFGVRDRRIEGMRILRS